MSCHQKLPRLKLNVHELPHKAADNPGIMLSWHNVTHSTSHYSGQLNSQHCRNLLFYQTDCSTSCLGMAVA